MSKLNVLYQFDENYAAVAGVSMTTLFENNADIDDLTVYLAVADCSEQNLDKFHALARQYQRSIVFLNTDAIYQKLKEIGAKTWNGSLATWMKMFVMSQMPLTVEQLLYLDSDTLVKGSLAELADLDMEEWPVAGVIDSSARSSRERLHLDTPYYNAGVIYFNLKYWRSHDEEKRMMEHLKENVASYSSNDQDLLNDFFRGRILQLSPKYNFQGMHFAYKDNAYFSALAWKNGEYYEPQEIAKSRNEIRLVHFFRFCGEYPWQPGNIHPCKAMFEAAKQNSLWADAEWPKKPLKRVFRVERVLYRIMPQKLFLKLLLNLK